jgi:16S rRNA (guanine527-N7)-methyltransferase
MAPSPLTAEEVAARCAISLADLARLKIYVELLVKWQQRINLVSTASLDDVWGRHVFDSAQLIDQLPAPVGRLADLGSGAGFPGLVLAILGAGDVHLIESDARKCAFLREASRATAAGAVIHDGRVEQIESLNADIVVARALAPLDVLLAYAESHLATNGMCLFLKGKNVEHELTDSAKKWMMRVSRIQSLSDPSGTILKLEDIRYRSGP